MADKEQRHKETLYEVERKFIIGKDKYVCELTEISCICSFVICNEILFLCIVSIINMY